MSNLIKLCCAVTAFLMTTVSPCIGEPSRTLTLEVVRDHAGGNDRHGGTWMYPAPAGYRIAHYRPIVRSTYGDATYVPSLVDDRTLKIDWATQSRYYVVDTKTASLNLDVEVTLVPMIAEEQRTSNPSPGPLADHGDPNTPLTQILVGVAVTVIGGILLRLLTRRRVYATGR